MSSPVARREITGGVAGAVVGMLLVAVLLATGHLSVPLRFSDRDATDDFMAAWRRSRTSTFVVDSEWKRTKDDGESLTSASRVAQAPPRRVLHQLGAITGELDGKQIDCFSDPDGGFGCSPGTDLGRNFEQGIEQEMKNLGDHFHATDPPLYRVHTDDHGCFELVQTRVLPDPTFGRLAQVCFDEASGAMRYSERHFENVTETLVAQSIRPNVSDADFDLTQDATFEPHRVTTSTAPPTTAAPGATTPAADPCDPGAPGWVPERCTNAGLLKFCISANGDESALFEMFGRRLSYNTPELRGTTCGEQYAHYGLDHGAIPR